MGDRENRAWNMWRQWLILIGAIEAKGNTWRSFNAESVK